MPNAENLIPNNARSPSEVRANGRKGGINSGKARREKQTLQSVAKMFLSMKATGPVEEMLEAYGVKKSERSNLAALFISQCLAAYKGNTHAAEWVASHIPTEQTGTDEVEDDPLTASLMEEAESLDK